MPLYISSIYVFQSMVSPQIRRSKIKRDSRSNSAGLLVTAFLTNFADFAEVVVNQLKSLVINSCL